MKFYIKYFLLVLFSVTSFSGYAQWSLEGGIGIATPITGYNEMVSAGTALQFNITKRLAEERLGVGIELAWARMHNDNNDLDIFQNVHLDQIPIFLYADYELTKGKWIPYAGLGLGGSLYNIAYDTSPTTGEAIFNVSFSFIPKAGVRMKWKESLLPFVELNAPIVTDGPPPGAANASQATGYLGVVAGIQYRF
ncbi:hypothetical protein [Solitalea lacus]|uniref:hypothetical protein n=1 Tax=Solitalea lacus TaxID=2911172 RepID=UPI001EDB4CAA|nr:hypothetical protein [Solitalea lacus]UKJ09303.1 hypothetical protein L2B55_09115 [Solitalea lacus]